MKVGMIGLGRMGEGMSRRMLKEGIEVYGYRRNYAKAQEAAKSGYITAAADSLESLVQVVRKQASVFTKDENLNAPGIFQLVIPAELVEETINELLPLCVEGDIIIDHGNSNFKDSRRRAERLSKLGIAYIDCGTSGGVYGWSVDTVLWLVVQILQYPPALQSLGHSHQGLVQHQELIQQQGQQVLSMVGCIVDHQVQVTL